MADNKEDDVTIVKEVRNQFCFLKFDQTYLSRCVVAQTYIVTSSRLQHCLFPDLQDHCASEDS